jgi:xylose isomerase
MPRSGARFLDMSSPLRHAVRKRWLSAGAMDLCARTFLNAVKMLEDGHLAKVVGDRYAGWQKPEAQLMLKGKMTLEEISAQAEASNADLLPRSGRQELLENPKRALPEFSTSS